VIYARLSDCLEERRQGAAVLSWNANATKR
jgi:hypothetical protein